MKKILMALTAAATFTFAASVLDDDGTVKPYAVRGFIAGGDVTLSKGFGGISADAIRGGDTALGGLSQETSRVVETTKYSKPNSTGVSALVVVADRKLDADTIKQARTLAASGIVVTAADKVEKDGRIHTVLTYKSGVENKPTYSTMNVANGLSHQNVETATVTRLGRNPGTGQAIKVVSTTVMSRLGGDAAGTVGAADKLYKFSVSKTATGNEKISTTLKVDGAADATKKAALDAALGEGWTVKQTEKTSKKGKVYTTYKITHIAKK